MATKIYKPEIVKESPINIEEKGYTGDMPANTNGFIKMSVEEDVVIQRISRDLYRFAASGFRELFVNEAKACRYATINHDADPRIEITLDPQNRKLVIEGIDSMGMTWEVFRDVYTVLGRSTNFDGEESGQFGFGRAAYTCLSEIMILEVYSRETGEKFAVMGKNGVGFQTGLPEPKMEQFGTRITLTLHKDIDYTELYSSMKSVPLLSQVYTVLNLNADIVGYEKERIEFPPRSLSDAFMHQWDINNQYRYSLESNPFLSGNASTIQIQDEDIEIIFSVPHFEKSVGSGFKNTYLIGVPIDNLYEGMYRMTYTRMINIKNERKFNPTPDRERLSEKASKAVTEKIDSLITDYLKEEYTTDTLEEFMSSNMRMFLLDVRDNAHVIRDSLPEILHVMDREVRGQNNYKTRLNHIAGGTKILVAEKMEQSKLKAIEQHDPDVFVFRPDNMVENPVSRFSNLGVQTVDEYLAEHGLEKKKETGSINVHYSCESPIGKRDVMKKMHKVEIESIDENTILASSNFRPLTNALLAGDTRYSVAKQKGEITSGTSEEAFFEKVESTKYSTSEGEMTVQDMIACKKPAVLLRYSAPNASSIFKNDKSIVIVENSDRLFEVATVLEKNKIKYHVAIRDDLFMRNIWVRDTAKYVDVHSGEEHGLPIVDITDWLYLDNYREPNDVGIVCGIYHGQSAIKDKQIQKIFIESVKCVKGTMRTTYKHVSEMLSIALRLDEMCAIKCAAETPNQNITEVV